MKQTKGFTLIEMMVVISIISLLSSVVLSVVNDVRKKADKTGRTNIINEYRKAFTLGYDKYGGYPNPGSTSCLGDHPGGTCAAGVYAVSAVTNSVVGEFLPSLPVLKTFQIGTYTVQGPTYSCIQLNSSSDSRGSCTKAIIAWVSPDIGSGPSACLPGIVAGFSGGYPNCNLTIE